MNKASFIHSDPSIARPNTEHQDLHRFIVWLTVTSVPMIAAAVGLSVMSDSLSLVTLSLDSGIAFSLNIVNIFTLGIIMKGNVFEYPYGTGKVENFAGFLYGFCIIPVALTILVASVKRYLNPAATVSLGLIQIYMVVAFIRMFIFVVWIKRLMRRYPNHSPLMQAYYLDYTWAIIYETAVMAGLFLGWVASFWGAQRLALIADLVMAFLISLVLLGNGLHLLARNFRSLIDLPLSEPDQYQILNALTQEFDEYAGVGNIYTQLSGNNRLIQIELYFHDATTVAEIERVRSCLEKRLSKNFSKIMFHLIPRQIPSKGNPGATEEL